MAHSTTPSDDRTRALATYVADLEFAALPEKVVLAIKMSVLDTIGSGLFGSTTPWGEIIGRFAASQTGPAALWGKGAGTGSLHYVAMANATMAHGFELDDLHPPSRSHPGAVMTPIPLGLSQTGRAISGRDMLAALAAGYEIQGRVGMSQGVSSFNRGWHPTGTAGSFGAAAAAAKLMGLDAHRVQHALGTAGTMPAGLMAAQFGAMVKRLYVGHATWAGLVGAELASAGFTGVHDIFDAEYGGYFDAVSDESKPDLLTAGLGERFEAGNIGIKFYPCVGTNQSVLDAMNDILREHVFEASEVERIDIRTTAYQKLHSGWDYEPTSVMAAQMSMQYCLAALIIERRLFVEQFTPEKIVAPNAIALAKRITITADETLDKTPGHERYSEAVVRLRNGTVLKGARAISHGNPRDPADWSEGEQKFRALAARVASPTQIDQIVSLVSDLENLPDIAPLAAALRIS